MKHIKIFEIFQNYKEEDVTTLADMMAELSTWVEFTEDEKKKADASGINTSNNAGFKHLVKDWTFGKYDEEPEFIANELRNFATKPNWSYNP